jgi:hypothetical protein
MPDGSMKAKVNMQTERTGSCRRSFEQATWEEETGFLDFLSKVYAEVARFDRTFDFGVSPLPSPPESIDGSRDLPGLTGFAIIRKNSMIPGRDYCLYSVLKGRVLFAYIGVYTDGAIETVRELKPLTEFRNGVAMLQDWLRNLIKASCEKI